GGAEAARDIPLFRVTGCQTNTWRALDALSHPDGAAAPLAAGCCRRLLVRIIAAVLPGTSAPIEVRELDLAAPRAGEVLVRLHASGVCHSDLNAIDGTSATRCPAVLGPAGAGAAGAGALVGCAVSTGVGAVWNTGGVRPGERVAVIGCGGVGLSAVLGALAIGASPVIAVDLSEQKLELARSVGATDTVRWAG